MLDLIPALAAMFMAGVLLYDSCVINSIVINSNSGDKMKENRAQGRTGRMLLSAAHEMSLREDVTLVFMNRFEAKHSMKRMLNLMNVVFGDGFLKYISKKGDKLIMEGGGSISFTSEDEFLKNKNIIQSDYVFLIITLNPVIEI